MADQIRSKIWQEDPQPDNHFAAQVARCHGFDVYGEMLGKATWAEMIYLLFRGEPPTPRAAKLFDTLALALANPGPRDASVHAAMCGGTSGTPAAAILMASLAVGAGQYTGGREILLAVGAWSDCGCDLAAWQRYLAGPWETPSATAWPAPEHPPGFDPHGVGTTLIVEQALACLSALSPGPALPWLAAQHHELESVTGLPLSLTSVAAAAFVDLEFSAEEAEVLYLILRLPGAAAHALEQKGLGHKKFPFYEIEFETKPVSATGEQPR